MSDGVRFVKMSGAGNDFIVLGPSEAAGISDLGGWIRRACRRGLSIGADGVLLVEPAGERVRVRFFNPDGGEAFCGNGTRCAARYARERWSAGESMRLETSAGEVLADVLAGGEVRLVLPAPRDMGPLVLEVGERRFEGRRVQAGVPHFVVDVLDLPGAPLDRWGPALRRHPAFGVDGTNVDLVAWDGGDLGIRTWERGVENETLSCGSGAVAAALVARIQGSVEPVRIVPASGVPLIVGLPGPRHEPTAAVLVGDARFVYEGLAGAEAVAGFGGGR